MSPSANSTLQGPKGDTGATGPASPGSPVLIYRYTVTGADKASIDTGVDAPEAGSNDWTNGDLLEVYLYSRTDEAVVLSTINLNFNNDTGANYDGRYVDGTGTTVSTGNNVGASLWSLGLRSNGASAAANFFGLIRMVIPNYLGAVGYKIVDITSGGLHTTGASSAVDLISAGFRSLTGITRIKFAPATGGVKFKIGTQLLIYKRPSS
jgi:hypothetical protein